MAPDKDNGTEQREWCRSQQFPSLKTQLSTRVRDPPTGQSWEESSYCRVCRLQVPRCAFSEDKTPSKGVHGAASTWAMKSTAIAASNNNGTHCSRKSLGNFIWSTFIYAHGSALRFLSTYEYGLGYTLKRQQKIKCSANGEQISFWGGENRFLRIHCMFTSCSPSLKPYARFLFSVYTGWGSCWYLDIFLGWVVGLQTQGSIKSLRLSWALSSGSPSSAEWRANRHRHRDRRALAQPVSPGAIRRLGHHTAPTPRQLPEHASVSQLARREAWRTVLHTFKQPVLKDITLDFVTSVDQGILWA